MTQLRSGHGSTLALIVALYSCARAHASVEVMLIGPLTASSSTSDPAVIDLANASSSLPTAIDEPELKDVTAGAPEPKPGRRMLAACADTVTWCASWKTSGYCDPKYVYNGQSVKDVVCAKTCNGAPCQSGSGCATVAGYTAMPNTDHNGDDIGNFGSIASAAQKCSSSANCAGFNSNGWVKTKVSPTQAWTGCCLYVKNGGSSGGSGGGSGGGGVTNAGCADSAATLASHNTYRALHSAPAMQWSASLANDALAWAKNLASQGCNLQHGGYGSAGQNLYAMWGLADMNCVRASDSWYSEVSQYKFTNTPWTSNQANFGKIGHFTQLVWKSSTQLGCGAAQGPNNCYVVACHYLPAGNVIGDSNFLSNVLPKKA